MQYTSLVRFRKLSLNLLNNSLNITIKLIHHNDKTY